MVSVDLKHHVYLLTELDTLALSIDRLGLLTLLRPSLWDRRFFVVSFFFSFSFLLRVTCGRGFQGLKQVTFSLSWFLLLLLLLDRRPRLSSSFLKSDG